MRHTLPLTCGNHHYSVLLSSTLILPDSIPSANSHYSTERLPLNSRNPLPPGTDDHNCFSRPIPNYIPPSYLHELVHPATSTFWRFHPSLFGDPHLLCPSSSNNMINHDKTFQSNPFSAQCHIRFHPYLRRILRRLLIDAWGWVKCHQVRKSSHHPRVVGSFAFGFLCFFRSLHSLARFDMF